MQNDIRKWFGSKNNTNENIDKIDNLITKNNKIESIKSEEEGDTIKKMKQLRIWTDGSSLGNGQKGCKCGGIGVFFGKDDPRNISKGILSNGITNNKCELLAVYSALEIVLKDADYKNYHIQIFTDSEYLINTLTKWAPIWKKNNWKKKTAGPIKNLPLIQKIREQMSQIRIQFIHVKAHTTCKYPLSSYQGQLWYGNKMADSFANGAARELQKNMT